MDRRLIALAILALPACDSGAGTGASVQHGVTGYIEYFYQGASLPLKVTAPPTLSVGVDTTIYISTYAEGCVEAGPMIVYGISGSGAYVSPIDLETVSTPPQPCAAGLREFSHELRIHPAVPQTFLLQVAGRIYGVDTAVTREVVLQVR